MTIRVFGFIELLLRFRGMADLLRTPTGARARRTAATRIWTGIVQPRHHLFARQSAPQTSQGEAPTLDHMEYRLSVARANLAPGGSIRAWTADSFSASCRCLLS